MTHEMKLAAEYWEKINNGTKTIECRLYDEKRKTITTGDIIEFADAADPARKIKKEVVALHTFSDFGELLDAFPLDMVGGETREQFLGVLEKFYPKEEQDKFGVVGMEMK